MKVLLLLIYFCFSLVSFSQIFTTDTIKYESGALEIVTTYSDKKINKKFILSNGKVEYSYIYPSIDTIYGHDSSYLISKVNLNGNHDGTQKFYYSNQILKAEINYSNGRKNGPYKYYSQKGIITYISEYKNDSLNGKVTRYYENGNILFQGNYSLDQPSGKRTFYDSLGNPFSGKEKFLIDDYKWFVNCKNGIPAGETFQFDNSDRILMSGNYLDGGLHGIYFNYDTLGKITKKDLFIKGEFITSLKNENSKAIKGLEKIITLEPKNINYKFELFKIQYNLKEIDLALSELNSILTIEPNNIDAIYNKGIIYFEKNEFEMAKELFLNTIQIDSKHCKAHYNLGVVEYNLNNNKSALKFFKKARKCDPQFEAANHNIDQLKVSRRLKMKKKSVLDISLD